VIGIIEQFYLAFSGFETDFSSFAYFCKPEALTLSCDVFGSLDIVTILRVILQNILKNCSVGFGHLWVRDRVGKCRKMLGKYCTDFGETLKIVSRNYKNLEILNKYLILVMI